MKEWYQSKTVWVGLLAALLGFLEQVQRIPELPPAFVSVLGVLIVLLRFLTRSPVATPWRKKND
jgi:hypothetical protein